MENHFGIRTTLATPPTKWWVWGTVGKMTRKFGWLNCDWNLSRMEQFSRWLSWTDPSKSLILKFCGKKGSSFPISNHTIMFYVWLENALLLDWNVRKLMSLYQRTQTIDWRVAWYGQWRLFQVQCLKEPLTFCKSAWGRLSNWYKLIDEGLNCQQLFPIYPTIVPHATCCKWVIQIEAMVVKLNGLSTASCYPCQCISEMSSCTLLIRLIILQGWTCVHHLRQMLCRYSSLEFCFLDAD